GVVDAAAGEVHCPWRPLPIDTSGGLGLRPRMRTTPVDQPSTMCACEIVLEAPEGLPETIVLNKRTTW
ncbi:jg24699, partial [Pararge aegeria aegeria]